ncbi:MAG: sulfate reduction electron transfer complex DsrMKJOP subunit DsrO [Candidatus Kapaibacterium sp.]
MKIDRRKFLKLCGGCAALGMLGGTGAFEAIAKGDYKPGEGPAVRWGMVIDLRKCGEHPECDACIRACHEFHNVPEMPDKTEELHWIWKEEYNHAFLEQENYHLPPKIAQKPVLLLCNQCDNPPCVRVCPTQATWHRESDGIVMMDWHRCIGCRYCMAACPYGSRTFNWRDPRPHIADMNDRFPTRSKGVVEKCTFCAELQVDGKYTEMPKCVQACPAGAMYFGNLHDHDSEINRVLYNNYSIRRKPELGTQPEVYYLV